MKKLGIAIKSTLQGSGEPFKVNPGAWDSKIVDIRDVLKHVTSLSADPRRYIIFFSFSEAGCYITVAHGYQGREGDNIAGWVFVPNDIQISGEEICRVLEEVRKIIFSPELPSRTHLDTLFGTSYPLKNGTSAFPASPKNGKFAKRDLTPATPLPLILGSALYQQYYIGFQAIFIEQYNGEVIDAVNLSAQPLTQLITVLPPATETMAMLGNGSTLFFASTGEPFNKPIRLPHGSKIELKMTRPGYEAVKFTVSVEGDSVPCQMPQRINWQKKITPADFIVFDRFGNRLNGNYQISINGQPLGPQRFMLDSELTGARITVTVGSGEPKTIEANLQNTPVTIQMGGNGTAAGATAQTDGVTWRVYLADGSRGEVTVSGANVKRNVSPLKGYVINGQYLSFKGSNPWMERIIGFGAAILLGAAVCGILALCGVFGDDKDKDKNAITVETVESPTTPETNEHEPVGITKEEYSWEQAISYLDSNDVWTKSELDKFPQLKGLYDDLNTFNFSSLNNDWKNNLTGSEKYAKLLEHTQYSEKNKFPVHSTGNPHGTYNPESVEAITISDYCTWINKRCVDADKKTTSKPTPPKSVTTNPSKGNNQKKVTEQEQQPKSGNRGQVD